MKPCCKPYTLWSAQVAGLGGVKDVYETYVKAAETKDMCAVCRRGLGDSKAAFLEFHRNKIARMPEIEARPERLSIPSSASQPSWLD